MNNMTTTNQKIFKESFVIDLREKLRTGETLTDYLKPAVSFPASTEWESEIKVDPEKLKLRFKGAGQSASNDLENAIAIYEAFPGLTEAQASDPRLWAYLTHVSLREYVMARWPIAGSSEHLKGDRNATNIAIRSVLSHWFASGNDRTLRRNAIARLWWSVHLTRAPWEHDEMFVDLKSKDAYRFTRILLSSQDIYSQVLERGFGRDRKMLIAILEFLEAHPDMTREQIRSFMKELNLELSVKNFSVLNRMELKSAISSIGEDKLSRSDEDPELEDGDIEE